MKQFISPKLGVYLYLCSAMDVATLYRPAGPGFEFWLLFSRIAVKFWKVYFFSKLISPVIFKLNSWKKSTYLSKLEVYNFFPNMTPCGGPLNEFGYSVFRLLLEGDSNTPFLCTTYLTRAWQLRGKLVSLRRESYADGAIKPRHVSFSLMQCW